MVSFFRHSQTGDLIISRADSEAPAGYEALTANSVDAAQEKHVPRIEVQRDGHIIQVKVGEVDHPMEPAHYIEWVALDADGRFELHELKPGQSPMTFFAGGSKNGTVYAFCNLHGLWKASF